MKPTLLKTLSCAVVVAALPVSAQELAGLITRTTTLKGATMKRNTLHASVIAGLMSLALSLPAMAQTSRYDNLANPPFAENRPTKETAQTLRDELLFQRATYQCSLKAI